MHKFMLIFLSALVLCSCATKPKVVSEHSSTVVINTKSSYNDTAVLTFWRKIEADGTKGKRFSSGISQMTGILNMNFPKAKPDTVPLDPGTYFLDSYQVPMGGGKDCISEGVHYTARNGWDDKNNAPHYVSFTVKEGQTLNLPEIIFTGCAAEFDNTDNVYTTGARWK